MLHLLEVRPFVIPADRASIGRALVAALGFHVNWYEGHHGYLPGNWDVLWSLSVEETFYLLFPLVCLTLRSPVALLLALVPLIVDRALSIGSGSKAKFPGTITRICLAWAASPSAVLPAGLGASAARSVLARVAMCIGVAAVLLIIVFRKTTVALGLVATGTHVARSRPCRRP